MDLDDLMILMTLGGIGLSIAYLRAELVGRLRSKAAQRREEGRVRELYPRPDRRARNASNSSDSTGVALGSG